ncbi:uncharacterized protein [Ptychodera flava]|uniref:uncharacterized protein n=1 Tax=Ptychodera flava TaxID=63121 RepID=UPI00396AA22E
MAVQNWVVDEDLGRIRPNHDFSVKVEPSQNGGQISVQANSANFNWTAPLMATVSSAADVKIETTSTLYQSNVQSMATVAQSQPVTSVYADTRMASADPSWQPPSSGIQNSVPFTSSQQSSTVQPFLHRPGFEIPRSGPLPAVSHFLGNNVGQFQSSTGIMPNYSQSGNNFQNVPQQGSFPPMCQNPGVDNTVGLTPNQTRHDVDREVKQLQDYMAYVPPKLSSSEHSANVMSLAQARVPSTSVVQNTAYQHNVHSSTVSNQQSVTTFADSHVPILNSNVQTTSAHTKVATASWEDGKQQIRQWLQAEQHSNGVQPPSHQPTSFATTGLNQGAVLPPSSIGSGQSNTSMVHSINGNGSTQSNGQLIAAPICHQPPHTTVNPQWTMGTDQVDGNGICYSSASTVLPQTTNMSVTSGQWEVRDRGGEPSIVKRIKTEPEESYANNQEYQTQMFHSIQLQTSNQPMSAGSSSTTVSQYPNPGAASVREGNLNSTSSEYATLTNVPLFADVNPHSAEFTSRPPKTNTTPSTALSNVPSSCHSLTNFHENPAVARTVSSLVSSVQTAGTAQSNVTLPQTYSFGGQGKSQTAIPAPTNKTKRKLPQNMSYISNLNLGDSANNLTIHSKDSAAVKGIPVLSIVSVGAKTVIEYKRAEVRQPHMQITTLKPGARIDNDEVPGIVMGDPQQKAATMVQDSQIINPSNTMAAPQRKRPKTVRCMLDERLTKDGTGDMSQGTGECRTDQNKNNSTSCQYCSEVFSSLAVALEHEKLHHHNVVFPATQQIQTRPDSETGSRTTNRKKSSGSQHRKLSDLIVKLKALRQGQEKKVEASRARTSGRKKKTRKMVKHTVVRRKSEVVDSFQENIPGDQIFIKQEPETQGYEDAGDRDVLERRLRGNSCQDGIESSHIDNSTIDKGIKYTECNDIVQKEKTVVRSDDLRRKNQSPRSISNQRKIVDFFVRQGLESNSCQNLLIGSECCRDDNDEYGEKPRFKNDPSRVQSSNVDRLLSQSVSCEGQVSDDKYQNFSECAGEGDKIEMNSALTVYSLHDKSISGLPIFSIVPTGDKNHERVLEFVGIHGQDFPTHSSNTDDQGRHSLQTHQPMRGDGSLSTGSLNTAPLQGSESQVFQTCTAKQQNNEHGKMNSGISNTLNNSKESSGDVTDYANSLTDSGLGLIKYRTITEQMLNYNASVGEYLPSVKECLSSSMNIILV